MGEQRHFTGEATRTDIGHVLSATAHFKGARGHDEHLMSGLALTDQCVSGLQIELGCCLGNDVEVVRVKVAEQWNLSEMCVIAVGH